MMRKKGKQHIEESMKERNQDIRKEDKGKRRDGPKAYGQETGSKHETMQTI